MAGGAVVVVGGTSGIGLAARRDLRRRAAATSSSPGATPTGARDIAGEIDGPGDVSCRALDLAEPETISGGLADVGAVDHLVLAAIERDQNTIHDYDIARAIRLVTLKLVGYTEVVHALAPRLDAATPRSCSSAGRRCGARTRARRRSRP